MMPRVESENAREDAILRHTANVLDRGRSTLSIQEACGAMWDAARLRGWIEGWQCARLRPDGSLPPTGEVREALVFAGFSDAEIDAALADGE